MKMISYNCKLNVSNVLAEISNSGNVTIREDIISFLKMNSGGYPLKDIVTIDGEEYEIRVFLSLDSSDENYYIEKPLLFFMENTNNKIIPIGLDSGDNYYCVNNETGKVYYWTHEENLYYCIADSLEDFIVAFDVD